MIIDKFTFQVLIPVFALGRAQELCILLESYWERMNLNIPIYFSLGLTEKVTRKKTECDMSQKLVIFYYF
jgi:Cft2 family RNA processing exonuclease